MNDSFSFSRARYTSVPRRILRVGTAPMYPARYYQRRRTPRGTTSADVPSPAPTYPARYYQRCCTQPSADVPREVLPAMMYPSQHRRTPRGTTSAAYRVPPRGTTSAAVPSPAPTYPARYYQRCCTQTSADVPREVLPALMYPSQHRRTPRGTTSAEVPSANVPREVLQRQCTQRSTRVFLKFLLTQSLQFWIASLFLLQEAVQQAITEKDKEIETKIKAIKKTNALEKKKIIKSFDNKSVQSRDVTREMETKYKQQLSELKLHYETKILRNEEELNELKKFKKESDYITGQLLFDADLRRKRELDQLTKQHENKLAHTQQDLEKEHLRELERVRKNHDSELKKAANLVERLRKEKKEQADRRDKKIAEIKQEKTNAKKRYSDESKESKAVIRDHEKNAIEYEKMALGAYNEGVSSARKSNKEKIAADKLKNEAKERSTRLGKDLEKVREDKNNLKDQIRDLENLNKSLENKAEQLAKQNANLLTDHQKEVTALKKNVSDMEPQKIEKVWVKNVNKRG